MHHFKSKVLVNNYFYGNFNLHSPFIFILDLECK